MYEVHKRLDKSTEELSDPKEAGWLWLSELLVGLLNNATALENTLVAFEKLNTH